MSGDERGAGRFRWDTITNVGDEVRRQANESEMSANSGRRDGDAGGLSSRKAARRVRAASRPVTTGTDGSPNGARPARRSEPGPTAPPTAARTSERPATPATAVDAITSAVPVNPPARTPAPVSELPDDRYLNRELSWLDFNARVLALAEDPSQPLLERAKFLAIFASNLDEFYMVRVAGLKRRDETGLAVRSADGLSPREQLARIAARSQAISEAQARVFLDHVRPELAEQGIRILRWDELARRPARPAVGLLLRAGLPGAHAAGGGPGAPVPLHLQPVAQPGRDRARPGGPHRAVRPGQGAQQRAAAGPGGHRRRERSPSCRWRT